ncbi:beta-1,3-glucanase family protein [uncultured Winogradskyella sp.]|uniref:beta-1,3-glucanase family protein n=1 Tax=uncultured Winogradskyella sp. TaxID=395353 RepID=UPI002609DB4A|nr:beta-1,3-glucanase family protein [uncultured Winogradskyella sp.]
MENCISVTVKNQSGLTMYLAVQYGDKDLWLSIADINALAWQPFNKDTCVKKIDKGTFDTPTTFDWNLIQYCNQQEEKVRMYVANMPLTGESFDPMATTFLYDIVEMGWNTTWNITNVDFFCFPMQLEGNNEKVGYKDKLTRADIFNDLAQMPEPFRNLFVIEMLDDEELAIILRYLSPSLYINAPFSDELNSCFQEAITTGMPLLANYDGNFTYGDYTLSNFRITAENDIIVDIKTKSTNVEATYTLSNINTIGVAGNIIISSPDDSAGKTAAVLIAAAVERGVLYNPELWGQSGGSNQGLPKDYYQNNLSNCNQYNYYAKVLHDNSFCGLSYTFPYDDIFLQAPKIQFNEGDHAIITIMPF